MRSTPELDRKLRERFIEAVDKVSRGNAEDFGRKMGHLNGGYVRQVVAGKKPVRESAIERVHAIEGCAGWFDRLLPGVVAVDLDARAGRDAFWLQVSPEAREMARRFEDLPDDQNREHLYWTLLNLIRLAALDASSTVPVPDAAPSPERGRTRSPASGRYRVGP